MILRCVLILCLACCCSAAEWRNLLEGRDLGQWEKIGDGLWSVTREGVLIGQRDLSKPEPKTNPNQSWLYTREEFGEFDLELEYWTRHGGNSGVSIRDTSRARTSFGEEADRERTPSHIGYEIQISGGTGGKYPTGSIYLFEGAKPGGQIADDWNKLEIESRNELIRVKLNGQVVAEHAGDPDRSKAGPIGLQLHDHHSIVMFRNIRIRPSTSQ
ncbi:MAG: 3-keto-disaccharide hydrolase [Bryobacteraceae bacterium]